MINDFSIFLSECGNAVKCLEAVRVLGHSENLRRLMQKLPSHLHDQWRNVVHSIKEKNELVMFQHLVEFVILEAKKANDPTYGKIALGNQKNGK